MVFLSGVSGDDADASFVFRPLSEERQAVPAVEIGFSSSVRLATSSKPVLACPEGFAGKNLIFRFPGFGNSSPRDVQASLTVAEDNDMQYLLSLKTSRIQRFLSSAVGGKL